MALEDLERVRDCVDPEVLAANLEMTTLSGDEQAIAIDGIVQHWAQFIVDAAMSEVTTRRERLIAEKSGHQDKLNIVNAQILEIDSMLKPQDMVPKDETYIGQVNIELDQTPAIEYVAWLRDKKVSRAHVLTRMHNIKPFWLTAERSASDPNWLSLGSWVEANKPRLIQDLNGESTGVFNRAASCLARGFLSQHRDESMPKRFGITSVVQDDTTKSFLVAKPFFFAREALLISNFGAHCMGAVLYMAAVQREEREQRQPRMVWLPFDDQALHILPPKQ